MGGAHRIEQFAMIMTKNELVTFIAGDAQVTKKAAAAALGTLVTTIQEALGQKDSSIRIPDLGTFRVSHRTARSGVNPQSQKKIKIPAMNVPPVQPFQGPEGRGEGSQVSKSAMNKLDLIEALSKQANLPLRKANEITNLVFDTMSKALVDGDRIEIGALDRSWSEITRATREETRRAGKTSPCLARGCRFSRQAKNSRKRLTESLNEPWIEERCSNHGRGLICGTYGKVTTTELAKAPQVNPHIDMRGRTSGEDARGDFLGGVYVKAQESVAVAHPCNLTKNRTFIRLSARPTKTCHGHSLLRQSLLTPKPHKVLRSGSRWMRRDEFQRLNICAKPPD